MQTTHIIVQGKVQGVFYRASAKKAADGLGISGWVKNTSEGNVEITASGTEQAIDDFLRWCAHGPEKAIVTNLIVTKREDEGPFSGFTILR